MTRGAFRAPGPWRVVFDGQSLNLVGLNLDLTTHTTYPEQVMADRRVVWNNVAISGASWTVLATTAATRLHPLANRNDNTLLVMCGGTADIAAGDSGATLYADEVAYANAARTAGFDYIICTTLVGNSGNDAGEETARLNHNSLLLADASNAFDAVVDFDVPPIDDWTDLDYYFDGVHWWVTGAEAAANLMAPALDAVLP